MTLQRLISFLEENSPPSEDTSGSDVVVEYLESKKVDSQRFQSDLCMVPSGSGRVDTLIVWDHIQSFIKGSFLAVKQNRHLTHEEYMNLGRKECRLDLEKCQRVYDAYEKV